jgi:hypothetical protein
MSQFEEEFVKTYDPQGYSYYKFGEGIANQGKQIAAGLTRRLGDYQNLINTQDPNELLADFESKMQNIQNLESNYIKNSNQFAYNSGQQIGNAINNNDGMGALSGLIGFASSMSEQKEAKRRLAAQKANLKQQRINKMSQVYYKAVEFNETKQKEYISRAAYAKDLKQEKYNLAFVKNLACYSKGMKDNWRSTSTSWLKNNCAKPKEPTINSIENKFIAKDVQTRKVAERKYKFYKTSGYDEFKEAAISYAASAANAKASAENYYLLGKYYATDNPILALSTILTVQKINPNYKTDEVNELIENTKNAAEKEINNALVKNDVAYINSFLNAGLDRLVKIDGRSILTEAIAIDNSDAVQTILNKYIDGLSPEQVTEKIQKTILLCSLKDSDKTIKRFSDLGVSVDFTIGDYHPIDLAVKGQSPKAFKILLDLSEDADVFKKKYKDSRINIIANIEDNPSQAARDIDKINDPEVIRKITIFLFDKIDESKNAITVLLNSNNVKDILKNDPSLNSRVRNRFVADLKKPSPKSISGAFLKNGLISFNKMPIYGDLIDEKPAKKEKSVVKEKKVKAKISMEVKIDAIIRGIDDYIATLSDPTQIKSINLGLNNWKSYKKRSNNLQPVEVNLVNTSYPPFAKKYGLPLDDVITTAAFSEKSAVVYKNLEEKSLALVAFSADNYDLFAELDMKFNLGQIQEKNGKSLLVNMLKDNKKLTSNPKYLSKNFNFKNQKTLKQIIIGLVNQSRYISSATFTPIRSILTSYGLENYQFSNTGGTILHWYVELLLKEVNGEELKVKSNHIEALAKGLKIDKTITNDNGLTAYQIYDSNFSKIKKYWKKGNRSALGGRGLIKGLTNKYMRKSQEKDIITLLKPF